MASAATAALASPAHGAGYFAELQVQQHHGGGVLVSGDGDEVSITKFGNRRLSASYSGPGKTTLDGLSGRLGRFGSVNLRFAPEGKPRRIPRPQSCTGGPRFWTTWEGTYTGSVRFMPDAGLYGLTRTGTFKGSVQNVPRWNCPGSEPLRKFDPHAGGIALGALNCDGRSFQATVEVKPARTAIPGEPPTTAEFSASWAKSVGIAKVTYYISAEGGPETAIFSDDLSEGTLTPPPPFHGEAKIARQGEAWTWSGSLSARFPGQTVNLTGDGFKPYATTFKPRPSTAFLFAISERC